MKEYLTSKELRLKEENILSSLYSSSNVIDVPNRIRDFYALCRGENLVSIKVVENVWSFVFIEENCFPPFYCLTLNLNTSFLFIYFFIKIVLFYFSNLEETTIQETINLWKNVF